jgi:hypothetical protein
MEKSFSKFISVISLVFIFMLFTSLFFIPINVYIAAKLFMISIYMLSFIFVPLILGFIFLKIVSFISDKDDK